MPALKYWDTGSSSYVLLTPGATTFPFTFMQTLTAPTVASSPYQINHNLNTTTPLVQIWDATTGQQVMTQITVVNANSIQITVAQNMPNNVNVIVVGSAQAPVPVAPANLATKSYVDAWTPSLMPAPVTSGSGLQTFTDALGDLWVAQNGIAGGAWKRARDVLHARMYRNNPISLNGGTLVSIPMDTVYRDAWGMNDGTGIAFLVTGSFMITMQLAFTVTAASQFILPRCYVGQPGSEQQIAVCQNYSSTTTGTISAGLAFNHVVTAAASHVVVQATGSGTQAITVGILWSYLGVDYLGTG